ncbi:FAD-binding oxidoreductase, partial [Spirillospora sp. NPDC049652]
PPDALDPLVALSPSDPRYPELIKRSFNPRFVSHPDLLHLPYSVEQVEKAVERAVGRGQRLTVRSGGHCLDNLVGDPAFKVLLDMSAMNRTWYDGDLRAFVVEPGATLGELFTDLYLGWRVTVPAGVCPAVGVGGHIAGGGYGPLSRQHGLCVDHLYGVEVVTIDKSGRAKTVLATNRPDDPNRDLWWAHTGGGGGNFGIVTKYLFRTPGVAGNDPTKLLPSPPDRVFMTWAVFPWAGLTQDGFVRLVKNHNAWHAANSAPGTPTAALHSALHLNTQKEENIYLEIRNDSTAPGAKQLLDDYIAAVSNGVGVKPTVSTTDDLWLTNATYEFPATIPPRTKSKGSHLRKPLAESQIVELYKGLTDPDYKGQCLVYFAAYGGKINTVSPTGTAIPQRDSIMKLWFSASWPDASADEASVDWLRRFYQRVFGDTGGMPVPNDRYDGCYINYPDIDAKDPAWNKSGVPWSTLYYKQNYPRLQRVKAAYDPNNVFRHPLSIDPA